MQPSSENLVTRADWSTETESICEEGEQKGAQHTTLWGTSIQDKSFGERVVDRLRPMKKKVVNPVTDGRMNILFAYRSQYCFS